MITDKVHTLYNINLQYDYSITLFTLSTKIYLIDEINTCKKVKVTKEEGEIKMKEISKNSTDDQNEIGGMLIKYGII